MNVYEKVTSTVLELMTTNTLPWRKAWIVGSPTSFQSGKPYRGINNLLLSMMGQKSKYWITFNQASNQGAKVIKGSKAASVLVFKKTTQETDAKEDKQKKEKFFMGTFSVFNLSQVEGIAEPKTELLPEVESPLSDFLAGLENLPTIRHGTALTASYNQFNDTVSMPAYSQFSDINEYWVTLFHELVHSTGHNKKLNRKLISVCPKDKAFEELVAELGACLLITKANVRVDKELNNSAAYIADWMTLLRSDKTAFARAAAQAQQAVDYLAGNSTAVQTEK